MLQQFLNHLQHNNLYKTTDKILLAANGSLEAIVLFHLFREARLTFGVAHCNFQPNGEISKREEVMLNTMCVDFNIPFHLKRVDRVSYARANELSVEASVRKLKHKFLEETLLHHRYDKIAFANSRPRTLEANESDSFVSDKMIWPLSFATRKMLLDYASFHRLEFLEDPTPSEKFYQRFLRHNETEGLIEPADKILLAVSGGMDSMVMLKLFQQTGLSIGVAHCNYQLRGEASRADEALVNMTCVDLSIPFHVKRFETGKYADENSLSIQMAARALRYRFFAELATVHQYTKIATAHHINDSLETVILNITRGTGIEGLSGIAVRSGIIVRPMLFASREEIEAYASYNKLQWGEDESNAHDDYQRNVIRHHVIPKLKELNPNLEETFLATRERIIGAVSLAKERMKAIGEESTVSADGLITIDRTKIGNTIAPAVVLWELIKDKGFNFAQCLNIVKAHQAGKKFVSHEYELFVTAHAYSIRQKKSENPFQENIDADTLSISNGDITLEVDVIEKRDFTLQTTTDLAQLDYDKLKFPLVWRRWKTGDSFSPLGMSQTKKVSDFLIDLKIPLPEKAGVSVVESNGRIAWVVGLRIADEFKVDRQTQKVLRLRMTKN